jgi:hypothetical protein
MKKLIAIVLFFVLSLQVSAYYCLPYAISRAEFFLGHITSYAEIGIKLGERYGYGHGFFIQKSLNYLDIEYNKVKKIKKFPVIVGTNDHAYVVVEESGKYWIVEDNLCRTAQCLYLKSKVTKEHTEYYLIK